MEQPTALSAQTAREYFDSIMEGPFLRCGRKEAERRLGLLLDEIAVDVMQGTMEAMKG